MTMQRESSGGGAVSTVLVFLSGIAIGMLCAKQSGSETREKLSDLLSKGRKRGEELLGRAGLGGTQEADTTDRGHEQVERATEGDEESHYESGKYT